MATLLKIDGTKKTILPANKKEGFTLDEIYAALDCTCVQRVYVNNGKESNMICDENAKCVQGWGTRINASATDLFDATYGRGRDLIVGNVLLCSDEEWK